MALRLTWNRLSSWLAVLGLSITTSAGCDFPARTLLYRGVVTSGVTSTHSFDSMEKPRLEVPVQNAAVRLDSSAQVKEDAAYCPPASPGKPPTYDFEQTDQEGRFSVGDLVNRFVSERWVVLCVDAPGHERFVYRVEAESSQDPSRGERWLNIRLRRLGPEQRTANGDR